MWLAGFIRIYISCNYVYYYLLHYVRTVYMFVADVAAAGSLFFVVLSTVNVVTRPPADATSANVSRLTLPLQSLVRGSPVVQVLTLRKSTPPRRSRCPTSVYCISLTLLLLHPCCSSLVATILYN